MSRLNAFLGRFDRTFGREFYRLSCTSGRLLDCLFCLRFCSHGLSVNIGSSLFCRFHCPFGLKIGNTVLCLDDIFLCGLHTFLTLLIKLVYAFLRHTLGGIGHLIRSVLGSRAFIDIIALFRLVLCLGISGFHTLRSNSGFVNGLNRTLDRISGLYISHTKPPFPEVLRSHQDTFFATTTSLPFCAEYSQVESVISLSPYSALTPVSYRASSLHLAIYSSNASAFSALTKS